MDTGPEVEVGGVLFEFEAAAAAAAAWTPAAPNQCLMWYMNKGLLEAILAWAKAIEGKVKEEAWLKKAARLAGLEDCELAALWAKFEKSNFNLSATEFPVDGTSILPLLVSEGLSSLLVGLLGGEWLLATVEKADFSFEPAISKLALLRTDSWWCGKCAAAKRLL